MFLVGCDATNKGNTSGVLGSDAASKVYVAPGEYDEFYVFMSGGFSGQVTVHGLPSGRLLKTIPVFSVDGEKGYGFNEETKPMLIDLFTYSEPTIAGPRIFNLFITRFPDPQ